MLSKNSAFTLPWSHVFPHILHILPILSNSQTDSWKADKLMKMTRQSAAAAYFNSDGHWWVTGGDNGLSIITTEMYTPNGGAGGFTDYTDLPDDIAEHVLVAVDCHTGCACRRVLHHC